MTLPTPVLQCQRDDLTVVFFIRSPILTLLFTGQQRISGFAQKPHGEEMTIAKAEATRQTCRGLETHHWADSYNLQVANNVSFTQSVVCFFCYLALR